MSVTAARPGLEAGEQGIVLSRNGESTLLRSAPLLLMAAKISELGELRRSGTPALRRSGSSQNPQLFLTQKVTR